ncbi:MAG: ABC transporter substrate-binding protein [Ktedonobacterales bacterium]
MRLGFNKLTVSGVLALAGMLAIMLAGCGTSSSGQSVLPDSQQIIHLPISNGSTDVATLDPALTSDLYSGQMIQLIYPGLVEINAADQVIPWAATALPTFDPTTDAYTFTVRSGMKWADGTPIDASTFAYSINRSLSPCTASILASYLFPIKDAAAFNAEKCVAGVPTGTIGSTLIGATLPITVVNPQTLVITLAAPAPYFLEAMTYPTSYAQPQTLIAQYGNTAWTNHLLDNGPFGGNMYDLSVDTHQGTITLIRNPNFWGTAPKLKQLDFTVYESDTAPYTDYLDGKLDQSAPASSQFKNAKARTDFHEISSLAIFYYAPNWTKPPFNDVRVRQAFDLAINKTVIANTVNQGIDFATNHIVPSGMPGYNTSLKGPDGTTNLSGNTTKATALMQAYANDKCGGVIANCPAIAMLAPQGTTEQNQDTAVLGMWNAAFPGLKITITYEDFNTLIPTIFSPNTPQIYSLGWIADYPDPQDWLSLQFSPSASNNGNQVMLASANTLMAEADQNLNPTQRFAEYNQAEQQLVTDVAWIPLDQEYAFWNVQPYVHNFTFDSYGFVPLANWDTMYLTAH